MISAYDVMQSVRCSDACPTTTRGSIPGTWSTSRSRNPRSKASDISLCWSRPLVGHRTNRSRKRPADSISAIKESKPLSLQGIEKLKQSHGIAFRVNCRLYKRRKIWLNWIEINLWNLQFVLLFLALSGFRLTRSLTALQLHKAKIKWKISDTVFPAWRNHQGEVVVVVDVVVVAVDGINYKSWNIVKKVIIIDVTARIIDKDGYLEYLLPWILFLWSD